jgi:signal peptidase I
MADIDPELLAEMLREALAQGKSPFLTVISNSMAPLIRRGDQIQLAPTAAEQLQPGDIIVVVGPANLITHRYWGYLSQDGQTQLLTRGDRPQHFDRPVAAGSLVGQVVARRRKSRVLNLTRGAGKWLNQFLTSLARLEIRLFAQPVVSAPLTEARLPKIGSRVYPTGTNWFVRLSRRFFYSWAIILTMIIHLVTFASKSED